MDSHAHAISWKELWSLTHHYQAPQDFEYFAFVPLTSNAKLRQISLSLHDHAPRDFEIFDIGITKAVRMRDRTPWRRNRERKSKHLSLYLICLGSITLFLVRIWKLGVWKPWIRYTSNSTRHRTLIILISLHYLGTGGPWKTAILPQYKATEGL
jgi:hypothetical protein